MLYSIISNIITEMNTKPIIIISILIIIGAFVAVFYNDENKEVSQILPSETNEVTKPNQDKNTDEVTKDEGVKYEILEFPDNNLDTSDWKTYQNKEFGFEVRYPSDWKVLEYEHPKGLFSFYHSRYAGNDNGIYIDATYNDDFVCGFDDCKNIIVNNMKGHYLYKGVPRTIFSEIGIILKNKDNSSNYSVYVFEDKQNSGNLNYKDVFEKMLLSFKSIE